MNNVLLMTLVCGVLTLTSHARAQTAAPKLLDRKLNKQETVLVETSKKLSATTTTTGKGWEAYRSFLHPGFTRWSEGQAVNDRKKSVDAIKQWWIDGNRVSSSIDEVISIQIVESTGVVRKKMKEQYVDKDGKKTGDFEGYVTQVWLKGKDGWQLFSATIQRPNKK